MNARGKSPGEPVYELIGTDALPADGGMSEEDVIRRSMLSPASERLYVDFGIYAGDSLRELVASCGGDASKIPPPKRACRQG